MIETHQAHAPAGVNPASITPGTSWHFPDRPPARIKCPRRPEVEDGIAFGLARDLRQPVAVLGVELNPNRGDVEMTHCIQRPVGSIEERRGKPPEPEVKCLLFLYSNTPQSVPVSRAHQRCVQAGVGRCQDCNSQPKCRPPVMTH